MKIINLPGSPQRRVPARNRFLISEDLFVVVKDLFSLIPDKQVTPPPPPTVKEWINLEIMMSMLLVV